MLLESELENITEPLYKIFTLGRFDVEKDNHSLVMESSGSKKIWELYKFMLTHRDQSFSADGLMNTLWISEEYSDPKSTLRRQMFRLREILKEDQCLECDKTLIFANGQYFWNKNLVLLIDADAFEKSAKQGDQLKEKFPEKALECYMEAIELYKGDYMADSIDQHWIYPMRNYYRRLYLKTVINTIEVLENQNLFHEMMTVCQKAVKIDVYEETFHLNYLEALLKLNRKNDAMEHYEYITSFFYREMGIKPSNAMKELYKRILKQQSLIYSENNIKEAFGNSFKAETAYYCEPEIFKSIYELERRRSERTGNSICIGVLSVSTNQSSLASKEELRMNHIKQLLLEKLRKGDTITRWNENQFLILLQGVDSKKTKEILERVIATDSQSDRILVDQVSYLAAEY
jgi:DNA-binding SARP family transcriptional activator